MTSNHLVSVEKQSELGLARRPNAASVPIEMVHMKKTAGAAFTLACDISGLEDKEIAGAMQPPIDPGTFSRIKTGTNSLSPDRMREFCEVVGNMVYPEWCAFQVGCTLVMIQSEAERQIAIERQAKEKAEAENKLLRGLLVGRAA